MFTQDLGLVKKRSYLFTKLVSLTYTLLYTKLRIFFQFSNETSCSNELIHDRKYGTR